MEKMSLKRVSVVLCTYNGEKYIREQLESIVSQTYPIHELLIQDDCSTDATPLIIEEYKEKYPFIRFYRNKNNLGFNRNFWKAFEKVTGDYIAISDQDDIWVPNKVKNVMAVFREGYDCVMHDCSVVNEHYEVLLSSIFRYTKPNYSWI